MKLEGRPKEITTKRKKGREVNWRERKRRNDRDSIHARYGGFVFSSCRHSSPLHGMAGVGGGAVTDVPRYPYLWWCKKDESKSWSDCWFNQSYEYRCGYFFVVTLREGGGLETWFLMVKLTSPLVNYQDSDTCLLHYMQNLLILFHDEMEIS